MAHTIGSIPARSASTSANPITFAQQILAGETVMAVLIKTVGATNRAGGAPDWGGIPLVQAGTTQKAVTSPEAGCEIWYLCNPPIELPGGDTRTLTIPNTGAAAIFYQVVFGRAAAGKGSEFGSANGGNATAANPSPGAVTCDEGGFVVAITAGGWTTWAPSAQAGTVISNNDDGAHGGGTQYALRSAGAFTCNWTFATSDDWGAVVATFGERPAHNLNNYMGVNVGDGMGSAGKIR